MGKTATIAVALGAGVFIGVGFMLLRQRNLAALSSSSQGISAASISLPYVDNFDQDMTLQEAGSIDLSASPYWWLNSGAYFIVADGVARTVEGELAQADHWRQLYDHSNPQDTDNGTHPQNIFRLVTRGAWHNVRQEVYFMIQASNLSSSPNRNESNGLLLFNRYRDENNLYYAGIRVDGTAVIKRKLNGIYTTLAQKKIFPGTYSPAHSPNLLPLHTWIGVQSEIVTEANHQVDIKLYTDVGRTGTWTQVLEATDTSQDAIDDTAHAGIRTDFMDVSFDDYRLEKL